MIPRWGYLVKPLGKEYNNTKTIANQEFTINTSIEDASYVNRMGVVCATPKGGEIPVGSIVVVHHNVFRTYLDAKGKKRKSNEFFRDGEYLVNPQRIYMYKDDRRWKTTKDYCFISPIDHNQNNEIYRSDKKEEEHVGIVKHSSVFDEGEKIGFTKNSEYEFTIDDQKVYRMNHNDICIKFN